MRSVWLSVQQHVDQTEQLNDSLVLAQILVPLQQEHVVPPVRTLDGQLAWPLLGRDNVEKWFNTGNTNHFLIGIVRSRHGQLQISTFGQLGGNVLQVQ